tara:strand:- start:59 stop:499 length:441 start_codon:yes stop_codon:yes gene_type:complete
MGNICRSPTAEGVFNKLLHDKKLSERFIVDSAGTHAYHVGNEPDIRSQQTAKQRGVELSTIRSRQVADADFAHFDYILAMDSDNYQLLLNASPSEQHHKIKLFLDFASDRKESDVPDPYYGGQNGFNDVFDLIDEASQGFLDTVLK